MSYVFISIVIISCIISDCLISALLLVMNDEKRNQYLERMSATFFKFRESNVLCDTTLITTDGDIPAHSVVLAAASSVFRDAFKTSGCEDSASYQLELPGISGALAESVLSFIYTGSARSCVRDETSQTLLAEMCQQLGIDFVSRTDSRYVTLLLSLHCTVFIYSYLVNSFGFSSSQNPDFSFMKCIKLFIF